ncbi:hypothetical protein [Oleidesulfovibrio sp.]|uniref:hypothetical protein n=1 Tax=Oleidesulfovibrio sp. TaxID=2909707 RepID=UPI003A8975F8
MTSHTITIHSGLTPDTVTGRSNIFVIPHSLEKVHRNTIYGTLALPAEAPACWYVTEALAQLAALHTRWLCNFSCHAFLLSVRELPLFPTPVPDTRKAYAPEPETAFPLPQQKEPTMPLLLHGPAHFFESQPAALPALTAHDKPLVNVSGGHVSGQSLQPHQTASDTNGLSNPDVKKTQCCTSPHCYPMQASLTAQTGTDANRAFEYAVQLKLPDQTVTGTLRTGTTPYDARFSAEILSSRYRRLFSWLQHR